MIYLVSDLIYQCSTKHEKPLHNLLSRFFFCERQVEAVMDATYFWLENTVGYNPWHSNKHDTAFRLLDWLLNKM